MAEAKKKGDVLTCPTCGATVDADQARMARGPGARAGGEKPAPIVYAELTLTCIGTAESPHDPAKMG